MAHVTKADVDDFLSSRTVAVVGVSRKARSFGNLAYEELKRSGYRVLAVHPSLETMGGAPCWPDVGKLPGEVDGAVLVVPPPVSAKVVEECADAGIPRVWFQHGAWNRDVVGAARARDLRVVYGECILMYLDARGVIHRIHRGLRRLLGRMPAGA